MQLKLEYLVHQHQHQTESHYSFPLEDNNDGAAQSMLESFISTERRLHQITLY